MYYTQQNQSKESLFLLRSIDIASSMLTVNMVDIDIHSIRQILICIANLLQTDTKISHMNINSIVLLYVSEHSWVREIVKNIR